MVASFELDRPAQAPFQQERERSNPKKADQFGGSQDTDKSSSSSSSPPPSQPDARPQRVAPGGASYLELQHQQQYESSYPQHVSIGERFRSKGAPKSRHWIISNIHVGAMDSINTEMGTVSDANDILVLKTTVSPLFCLFPCFVQSMFCVYLACCVESSFSQLPRTLFLKLVERDNCTAT